MWPAATQLCVSHLSLEMWEKKIFTLLPEVFFAQGHQEGGKYFSIQHSSLWVNHIIPLLIPSAFFWLLISMCTCFTYCLLLLWVVKVVSDLNRKCKTISTNTTTTIGVTTLNGSYCMFRQIKMHYLLFWLFWCHVNIVTLLWPHTQLWREATVNVAMTIYTGTTTLDKIRQKSYLFHRSVPDIQSQSSHIRSGSSPLYRSHCFGRGCSNTVWEVL